MRSSRLVCWSGETIARIEISDVPMAQLYEGYADLSRMTEWSPLLSSVTVDPKQPNLSVWVMRVPKALRVASRLLGYPQEVRWEADLDAPGPPMMSWTSVLDADGRLKGLPNAGFEPSGRVEFEQLRPGVCEMTLCLRYTMPDSTPNWQISLVQSAPVQFVLTSRMTAGMRRFSKQMHIEWSGSQLASTAETPPVLGERGA